MNERVLRFRDVRVIGPDGEQVGIMQSRQALTMAKDAGLDLVMVSPTAVPPVCRIIDYGRHKYMTEKLNKEKKSKTQELKGIKISPRIAAHDIQVNLNKAKSFIEVGHKVKVTCQFKAREVTHPELGLQKLQKMAEQIAEIAVVERAPSMEGRLMTMILAPKVKQGTKNAKAENKQDGRKAVQSDGDGQDNKAPVLQQPPVPPQEREPEETA